MLASAARRTAHRFSLSRQASRALELYESLLAATPHVDSPTAWTRRARRRIEAEWTLWSNLAHAATRALEPSNTRRCGAIVTH